MPHGYIHVSRPHRLRHGDFRCPISASRLVWEPVSVRTHPPVSPFLIRFNSSNFPGILQEETSLSQMIPRMHIIVSDACEIPGIQTHFCKIQILLYFSSSWGCEGFSSTQDSVPSSQRISFDDGGRFLRSTSMYLLHINISIENRSPEPRLT